MNKKILTIIASILVMTFSIFGLSKSVVAKEVAYLSASSANTWLAASVKEMDAVASANGINITEFDAQFDPAKQTAQLQDAIASGKYDGIVLCAIYVFAMQISQTFATTGVLSSDKWLGEALTWITIQPAEFAIWIPNLLFAGIALWRYNKAPK